VIFQYLLAKPLYSDGQLFFCEYCLQSNKICIKIA
jgi:hypothetical protein